MLSSVRFIHRDLVLSSVLFIHRDLVLSSVRFIHRDLELSSVRFSHRDLVLRNEAGLSAPTNKKLSPMLKGPEIRRGPHRPLELHKITRSRLGRVG